MANYENIESFYADNKNLLINGDLRPVVSYNKDAEEYIKKLVNIYKENGQPEELTLEQLEKGLGVTRGSNVASVESPLTWISLGLIEEVNNGKNKKDADYQYRLTNDFKELAESEIIPGVHILNKLYAIDSLSNITKFSNLLLCTLREGYLEGFIIDFPRENDKYLNSIKDLELRKKYSKRINRIYGYAEDTNSSPHASMRAINNLVKLELIKQCGKTDEGFTKYKITEYGHRLLSIIDNSLSNNIDQKNFTYSFWADEPLQQIFYGAPGTGKSWKIDNKIQEKNVIRTTFHPDSDYSTFVGAYKPIMDDVETKVVPVVENYNATISCQSTGSFKEKKIVYKFVRQAFLKAYIEAWKKYADLKTIRAEQDSVEVSYGIDTWIIDKVDDNKAYYKKESHSDIDGYKKRIQKAWKKGLNTGNYHETAAISWYKNNTTDEEKTAEKCWEAVWKELNEGKKIIANPGGQQEYSISLEGDTIVITAEGKGDGKGAYKDAIKKQYEKTNDDSDSSVQKAIAQKLKEYGDDFEEAWVKLKEEVEDGQNPNSNSTNTNIILPQFLVIEEINRGNCAQIFGDIFQLLDRNEEGFSEYPIEADTDLQREIKLAFDELNCVIDVEGKIKRYKSNYGKSLSEDIQEGRVLLLPPNLYIWATMNTSDQSLFPMDSAFKRRWEWEYVPICYDKTTQDGNENKAYEFTITINNNREYSWINFLRVVNYLVKKVTDSEDKQMGNFFIKHDVKETEFIGKVMYYLWSEVCKDNFGTHQNFFRKEDDKEFSFNDLFDNKDHEILLSFMKRLQNIANEIEELKDKGIKIEIEKDKTTNTPQDEKEEN